MSISKAASGRFCPVHNRETLADSIYLAQLHYRPTSSGTVARRGIVPQIPPARYFYDDRGSELFEQICELPEYYLTRTETAILQSVPAKLPE